jgi:hypothetical protein
VRAADMTGPMGTAFRMTIKGSKPDHQAHIVGWLIESRQTGLPWWQYQLSVIHLRPIPGVRPPYLRFPEATHEVMVIAYDPAYTVSADGSKRGQFVTPINFTSQFVSTDEKAARLAEHLTRLALDGALHLEPCPSAATVALAVAGSGPWLDDRRQAWWDAIREFTGGRVA